MNYSDNVLLEVALKNLSSKVEHERERAAIDIKNHVEVIISLYYYYLLLLVYKTFV